MLERYLPSELVYRNKAGFSFSFERYSVPQFRVDVEKALTFHAREAELFGLEQHCNLLQINNADTLIKKFPRFAFALVSNWKIFSKN